MVLLSKLNAAGIFWVRTFCVVNSLLPYFECKTGSMFPLFNVLSLSFRFILLPFLLDLEGTSSIAAVLRFIDWVAAPTIFLCYRGDVIIADDVVYYFDRLL